MTCTVFISHSLGWGDDLLLAQFCSQLKARHGVACHIAKRNWKFGPSVIVELEAAIHSVDCVLAVLLNEGTEASYVNQEVGIALDQGKPVVAIAEKSAYLAALLQKVPQLVVLDFEAPLEWMPQLHARLAALPVAREAATALFWLLVSTLGEVYASRD